MGTKARPLAVAIPRQRIPGGAFYVHEALAAASRATPVI
jgi:hypothetical protein